MNTKNKSILAIIFGVFIFIAVFGFATPVLADGGNQPNYGDPITDPITVDGDTSDWDLTINGPDHFATMYREVDSVINTDFPEADVYLRFSDGILYVLVLSQNGQNVNTGNGQFVIVDQPDEFDVSHHDAPPDGTLPDLQWVNLNGSLSEGWEAALVWEDAINWEANHEILVHSLFIDDGIQKAQTVGYLPIFIYSWDFGDLDDAYGTSIASNGPKHSVGSLRLGSQVDGEDDGQPTTDSLLDDLTDRNDEDGAEPVGNWLLPSSPAISYTINGCPDGCYLNIWVDWDGDSTTATLDQVVTDTLVSEGEQQTLTFSRPQDTPFSETVNVRIRLCDSADVCDTPHALSPTDAPPGEVEDYQWEFHPTAVTINSFSATPTRNSTILYILAGSIGTILILGTTSLIQKRKF